MIDRGLAPTIAWLARLVTGATVAWPPDEPLFRPEDGPTVFIANHSSHADFVVLWSVLPGDVRRATRPVAARDYWGRGAGRILAEHVFRAVLIDRAGGARRTAVDRMLAALGESGSLILFPEGTRSLDGRIGPFRGGLYRLCVERPGLRVVPVRLVDLHRVLPKGHVLPVPLLSRVAVGPAIHLGEGESRVEFLDRARRAVEGLA